VELIDNLSLGLSVALTPVNLIYVFVGALIGTLIGVLPGIGPLATVAMLLPLTFTMSPASGLIMIAGIYYGAQYGGSTSAILVRMPGESSSVVTILDGHAMALQGRAGPALAIAAIGSFIAGCFATFLIAAAAPALGAIGLKFHAAEYFSLMVLGLIAAVVLSHGAILSAIGMILLGLLVGLIGTDVNSGIVRFAGGITALYDGLDFVIVAMGLFALPELITNLERKEDRRLVSTTVRGLMPTREDIRASWKPIIRGAWLGSALGILPGGGAILSSFASYALEKKLSRTPERFGKGAIEGVAGPEAANNAGAQTSFIPMLTLGIPTNPIMALMIGALMIHGIAPGPRTMMQHPDLFWGLIVSMWIGNLALVILNLPLINLWVRLLRVPYRLLVPSILVFISIGVLAVKGSTFDILMTAFIGLIGYVFVKLDCEPAPFLLGFILGPLMEENFRRSLIVSDGDLSIFVTRPISLTLLLIAAGLLVLIAAPMFRKTRQMAFAEEAAN